MQAKIHTGVAILVALAPYTQFRLLGTQSAQTHQHLAPLAKGHTRLLEADATAAGRTPYTGRWVQAHVLRQAALCSGQDEQVA